MSKRRGLFAMLRLNDGVGLAGSLLDAGPLCYTGNEVAESIDRFKIKRLASILSFSLARILRVARSESDKNRLANHLAFNGICDEALFMSLMVHLCDLRLGREVVARELNVGS